MDPRDIWLRDILIQHSGKDFVRRILNPKDSPKLKNKDGSVSTHLMGWGEANGQFLVYPNIVNVGGKLKRLSDEKAYEHAMKTGEYIKFQSSDDAAWFSKNYKRFWNERK